MIRWYDLHCRHTPDSAGPRRRTSVFTLTARTARMLRRPFTRRPHTVSRPVTPRNHLRGPEWLEGRFCPADLWYRGGMTNAFGDPAAWSTSPTAYTPPSNPP